VRADDDVRRPCRETERHSDGVAAVADDDHSLTARLVAVTVRADVRVGAVHVRKAWDVRPDVAQAGRQEQAAHRQPISALEAKIKAFLAGPIGAQHDSLAQDDTIVATGFAASRAQLRWLNGRQAEIAVDSARLPVARIAAVDEEDRVEIARRPDGRGQTRGSSTD